MLPYGLIEMSISTKIAGFARKMARISIELHLNRDDPEIRKSLLAEREKLQAKLREEIK